ncbi:hypothetical protein FPOAC2_01822 [Fusarium poae]|uniref:hypothetical protein n=1 Tax=Fusarium poae TaxID=36050 RepID=UPI001CE748D1|nr:hypothetical protein FPOAC1_001738 [Fusarium poae]KAG8675746.1 hypothetical protein FPOAC1_001738 [Fusarium poae]
MKETTQPELRNLMGSESVSDLHCDKSGDSLQQSSPSWLRRVGFAIPLLIIPIAYTILLAMMGHVHRTKQSSFGDTILEVVSIASTLWPILFAAVLGPLLKTVALFRAERGSTLGSLEFLLTSQTTASALKNFVTMGWIGSWAMVVLTVWSLSPLGGQAALRSLHRQQNPIWKKTPAAYHLGNNKSEIFQYYRDGLSTYDGLSGTQSSTSDMETVFSASFSTQDVLISHANSSSPRYNDTIVDLGGKWEASRSGRRDLWRNVRIPFIELLPAYRSDDPNAWIPVPNDEIVPHASLVGLPIRNGSLEGAGNSTMVVHFHYITLSCGKAFNGSQWVSKDSKALWYHNTSSHVPLYEQYQDAGMGDRNIWLDLPNSSTTMEHFNVAVDVEPQSKLQLVMGGECWHKKPGLEQLDTESTSTLRVCDMSTTYVDMEVVCSRLAVDADLVCQANRVRHAPSYPIKGNLTALSNIRLSEQILIELTYMGARQGIKRPTILEMYLRDPLGIFQRSNGGFSIDYDTTNQGGCFTSLPPEIFEKRLAAALNTIIMASYPFRTLTGGEDQSFQQWQETTALWTEFDRDIYVLDKPWFITTIISTLIMIICAVANIIIRQRIKAPDFLDNIAGLTRDSQFIDLPDSGSGKSGSDQLATIKNVSVRICDVYPEREVGRIALTTELNSSKLEWERNYS